jgi:hypothetical protein
MSTGHIVFDSEEVEQKAKAVFRRYGLDLYDYIGSWSALSSANAGITWAAREVCTTAYLTHRCSDKLHDYPDAFKKEDLVAVRRLAGSIALHDKIAKEIDRTQRMVNVQEKPRTRTDARKNAVIAYLLRMQDLGGLDGSTLEQVQTTLFALTFVADNQMKDVVRGHRTPASKNLLLSCEKVRSFAAPAV